MDINFKEALELLTDGKLISRKKWSDNCISDIKLIFMQVPSVININTVEKMQSLPNSAKKLFKQRFDLTDFDGSINNNYSSIKYNNQLAMVDNINNITGYSPSVEDILADDWYLFF